MHLGPSPWLGCFSTRCGERFQFDVKKSHISKTSCSKWGHHAIIPLVHAFYAFESPTFYNHHNHEGEVTVIPSPMGTHQGDPLGRAQFILVHFKALNFTTSQFPSCLFSFIIDDTHIIGPLQLYHLHMSTSRSSSM